MTVDIKPDVAAEGAEPLKRMATIKAKVRKPKGRPVDEAQLPLIESAVDASITKGSPASSSDPFKDEVLPLFNLTRDDFLGLARRVALMLHKKLGRPITVDDVRAVMPPPPEWDGRVMGAIFKTREWEWHAFERSTRTVCHKRGISSFVPSGL